MPDNIGRRNQTGVRYYIVFVCLVVGEKRGCDVMGRDRKLMMTSCLRGNTEHDWDNRSVTNYIIRFAQKISL